MIAGVRPQHAAEIERLHAISVEIASLQELQNVMDRALDYCLTTFAEDDLVRRCVSAGSAGTS